MCIFSMFSFSSCSLVTTNEEYLNSTVVLTIAGKELTREDIVSAFYTYYQSNYVYFAYYDEETIEESFYTWVIIRQVLVDMAEAELYSESNPEGHIYYTQEDDDEVWQSTIDYIYSQISSYEEAIYENEGFDEDDYPTWLQDDEDEEEESVFSAYESSKPVVDNSGKKDQVVEKLTDDEIVAKIASTDLKTYLMQYVKDVDEDGNEERASISELEKTDSTQYVEGARNQAYTNYIEALVNSAKASGTSTNPDTVFNNEVIRIYTAYYESKITELFQEYYLNEYITNYNGDGDSEILSDYAIAAAFIERYYTDSQIYQSEESYISVMESSDGASLVLYHYNGNNYFFTVQHILLTFSDNVNALIQALPGYSSSAESLDSAIYESFKYYREELVEAYQNAVLTTINTSSNFDLINEIGNYYYYDETLKDLYGYYYGTIKVEYDESKGEYTYTDDEGNTQTVPADYVNEIYLGYVKLRVETTEEDDETVTTYYKVDTDGSKITYSISDSNVAYMATLQEVLECYKTTWAEWLQMIEDYIQAVEDGNKEEFLAELFGDDTSSDEEITHTEDYIFETIDIMLEAGYSTDDIIVKIDQYLFVELEWLYSDDTLDNELSNKMGYVISNYLGENGSWVAEFAIGARELISKIEGLVTNNQIATVLQDITSSNYTDLLTNVIISSYGYHIIKIEEIFVQDSSLIDPAEVALNLYLKEILEYFANELVGENFLTDLSLDAEDEAYLTRLQTALISESGVSEEEFEDMLLEKASEYVDLNDESFVEALVQKMKTTFVCLASNETVFDYFYDIIYTDNAGSSSSSSYFLAKEYEWLYELYQNGDIVYVNYMDYDDLIDALS